MSKPGENFYCKECRRVWKAPHTVNECIVAQIHEEDNPLDEAFEAISRIPLKPTVFYMSQEDWDDIVKWSHSNK